MLPDQKAGALDVARIGETDEQPVTVGRGPGGARRAAAAQRRHVEGTVAGAATTVDELHAQSLPRVAAGVAVLHPPRDVSRGQAGLT